MSRLLWAVIPQPRAFVSDDTPHRLISVCFFTDFEQKTPLSVSVEREADTNLRSIKKASPPVWRVCLKLYEMTEFYAFVTSTLACGVSTWTVGPPL